MQPILRLGLAIVFGCVFCCEVQARPVAAFRGPPPAAQHLLRSHTVIVGKITAIEANTVEAEPYPNTTRKVRYQVAVIEIIDRIKGADGLTTLRLGYVAAAQPSPVKSGPGPVPVPPGKQPIQQIRPVVPKPIPRYQVPAPKIEKGLEGIFFLKPHHKESFYVAPMAYDVVPKANNRTYASEVERLKRCAKILQAPKQYLKSKTTSERLLAASLLLAQYNTPPEGAKQVRRVPIDDREESQAILEAIASADWKNWRKIDPATGLSPVMLFGELRLSPKDGWNPRFRNYLTEFPVAAQKWLKEHANSYRVHRWVADQ
ncbi:MAG: hypothetical protein KatS3mg105_1279 [Gemmatales bacterium]|nr:MAG: hypothetical protein KatS3mg105_1279 [Gemmatales bacterium]